MRPPKLSRRTPIPILALVFAALGFFVASALHAEDTPAKQIHIEANDQMKFSIVEFEVAPGERVELTLKNAGRLPKEAMGHNLVILKADVDSRQYVLAATSHATNDYMDPALSDQVVAATKMLGPYESDTIIFTAPTTPGEYEYVCTFPGHLALGMKGVMKVL
jgi:azurin